MIQTIQLRRDTEANWSSANPILAKGEFGVDLTNKKFKIGDGITAWNDLSYNESAGDMLKSVYDPTNVAGDAFSMDNMVETTDKKIFTSSERSKLDGIEPGANNYSLPNDVVIDSSYVHTDNNYTTTEKNKLAGIEDNATADQTGSEIKSLYEAEPDTNAYTDAEKTKLAGIEENANNYDLPATVVHNDDYATSTVGGVIKMRAEGSTLYITNDGTDA